MDKTAKIYSMLEKRYGRQNWWPVTLDGELMPKYVSGKRSGKHKFEIIIGAILTQNTSWKNVEKAIINLNENNLIDVSKINKTGKGKLAQLIRSSGYYNQKAKKLKEFCKYLVENYQGDLKKLFSKNTGELRRELLKIHGIGEETADSIILYAAEKPSFVADAYTKRIFSRIGVCNEKIRYNELQKLITKNIRKNTGLYNQYHALLVTLGKEICRKKEPMCNACPLNKICKYWKRNKKATEEYLSGKITLSEAGRRAGLTLWEMEKYLVEQGFKSSYRK